MSDALSAMEYPHWLMVAEAILVVLGFFGLAFRQRPAPTERTEVANRIEQRRSELEAEMANRKSKLAEQTKDRRATEAKPPPGEHS